MRLLIFVFLLLSLFACNKNSGTPTTQAPKDAATTPADASKVPTQAEVDSRVHVGTVKTVIQADGPNTTFIEVAGIKSTYWIAVSKTEIKQGATIQFSTSDAVVMENFKSNVLNRTFDRILFVSKMEVK